MKPRASAVADLAVVAIFVVAISLPGLGLLFGVDRATISDGEMRELAKLPAWSWQPSAMSRWIKAFEPYFSDHFALRARLLKCQQRLLWFGLHTTPSDNVIAGKDGWMFLASDSGLEDYVQTRPFTAAELEDWRMTLERTRDWLKSLGSEYLVVIAPDKPMIYPEKMPESLRRLRPEYRVDQLTAHLRAHSSVRVLDLRPALIAAKPSGLLYQLYDSHWNDRGALVGYQAIARELCRSFPAIAVLERSDFDESPAVPSGDKTPMLGFFDRGRQAMPGLVLRRGGSSRVVEPAQPDPYGEDGRVVTEIAGSSLPRAVMFRDSFASRLIPYLSENFSRIVYLWENYLNLPVVRQERPDVVIQLMAGRHIVTLQQFPDAVPH